MPETRGPGGPARLSSSSMTSSKSKTVVITGVTSGIGRALAAWLAGRGHRVAGCGRLGSLVQKSGLKLVKEKRYSQEKFTVIPTLTARIHTMRAGENGETSYFTVIHLTLSKWLSNWSGTKRILAPVYTWSEKKMAAARPDDLVETIETAVTELTEAFLTGFTEANREEKPVEDVTL